MLQVLDRGQVVPGRVTPLVLQDLCITTCQIGIDGEPLFPPVEIPCFTRRQTLRAELQAPLRPSAADLDGSYQLIVVQRAGRVVQRAKLPQLLQAVLEHELEAQHAQHAQQAQQQAQQQALAAAPPAPGGMHAQPAAPQPAQAQQALAGAAPAAPQQQQQHPGFKHVVLLPRFRRAWIRSLRACRTAVLAVSAELSPYSAPLAALSRRLPDLMVDGQREVRSKLRKPAISKQMADTVTSAYCWEGFGLTSAALTNPNATRLLTWPEFAAGEAARGPRLHPLIGASNKKADAVVTWKERNGAHWGCGYCLVWWRGSCLGRLGRAPQRAWRRPHTFADALYMSICSWAPHVPAGPNESMIRGSSNGIACPNNHKFLARMGRFSGLLGEDLSYSQELLGGTARSAALVLIDALLAWLEGEQGG